MSLSRHSRAKQFCSSDIRKISSNDDNLMKWEIISSNRYIVSALNGFKTHKCRRKCKICKVCFHMFSCECLDYKKGEIVCEHIHACLLNVDNKLATSPQPKFTESSLSSVISNSDSYSIHEEGCDISPLNIFVNSKSPEEFNSWEVFSKRNRENFFVKQISFICDDKHCLPDSEIRCVICKQCIHTFSCTCDEYECVGIMCKHIHACIVYFKMNIQFRQIRNDVGTEENIELLNILYKCEDKIRSSDYTQKEYCKLMEGLLGVLKQASQENDNALESVEKDQTDIKFSSSKIYPDSKDVDKSEALDLPLCLLQSNDCTDVLSDHVFTNSKNKNMLEDEEFADMLVNGEKGSDGKDPNQDEEIESEYEYDFTSILFSPKRREDAESDMEDSASKIRRIE